ncbi:MAG: hypothetical protein CVU34_09480 [Betaproteobacteria bacterium HGW-Betaproteobacteria-7]|jgi:hypothetical protein|nr:MAG: hypothetical protein CVU34_09480 [Betaproteobacteria bacterium HGW-Betaproteobacteria-7]
MIGDRRSQQGIILIGLMLILMIAAGATYLQQANRSNTMAVEREAKTTAALLAARDELLARAILDANRPGSLRCPSIDDFGISPLATPCPSYAGRFPWRTVDTTDFRDSSGTALWYVLAPAFQDGNTPINSSSSTATLSLNGQPDIIALIIAPGGALAGQNRPSNNIADYLDDLNGNPATSNRDGDDHFFSGTDSNSFNDRIIAITKTAWQDAVAKRILGEIRYAVAAVGGSLPEADTNNDGMPDSADIGAFPYKSGDYASKASTTWQGEPWHKSLEQNGWFPLVTYDRLNRTLSLDGHTVTLP